MLSSLQQFTVLHMLWEMLLTEENVMPSFKCHAFFRAAFMERQAMAWLT